jgi:hypothetical protein
MTIYLAKAKPPARAPIDSCSEVYRPEVPSSITSIAIATTDPLIEIVANYQPEWQSHPDDTLVVNTEQVDERRLLALDGPEIGRPDDAKRTPNPSAPDRDEDRGAGQALSRRDPGEARVELVDHARLRPSHIKRVWAVAGIILFFGTIGVAGYYCFRGTSSSRGKVLVLEEAREIRRVICLRIRISK